MFLNLLHLLGTEYVVLLSLVAREARQAVHDETGNIVETMKQGSRAAGQPGSRAAGHVCGAQKLKKHGFYWFVVFVEVNILNKHKILHAFHVCGAQRLKTH